MLLIEETFADQSIEFEGQSAGHNGVIPTLMHKVLQESEEFILVLFSIAAKRDLACNVGEHDEEGIGINVGFALIINRCEDIIVDLLVNTEETTIFAIVLSTDELNYAILLQVLHAL